MPWQQDCTKLDAEVSNTFTPQNPRSTYFKHNRPSTIHISMLRNILSPKFTIYS